MKLENVHVQGAHIRVWVGGNGPALLLLHAGYGDAKHSWQYVWEDLAKDFRVIAPDIPGFGPNQKSRGESIPEICALFAEMLRRLGASPALVAGNSIGASIAFRFAQEFPVMVRKLILINGVSINAVPGWLNGVLNLPIINGAFVKIGKGFFYSKKALDGAFTRFDGLPGDFRDRLLADADRNSRTTVDMWLATPPSHTPVQIPIALVWGKDDEMAPMQIAREFAAQYPQATLHPINNARHMPEVEQPEAFISAIKREAAKILTHNA